jgi:arylsulfatase A-like enzyme
MDEGIGRVIQTLKNEGVYDNTFVFYFSDNGGAKNNKAVNLPFRGTKHTVYEGGLRVPFVMSWPGKLTPATSDEPVISIDILPTLCAALDIPLPENRIYDGRNMLSAIQKNTDTPLHERLFFDGNDNSWAVREGKWKLLYSRKGNLELYNLEDDAVEQKNLVEEFPEIATDLKEKYTGWRNEMGTPMGKRRNKQRQRN